MGSQKIPPRRNITLQSTIDGTVEEKLASMEIIHVQSGNPNNIIWPEFGDNNQSGFHVELLDGEKKPTLFGQTVTDGVWGYWLSYKLEKGVLYYLHFKHVNQQPADIYVPIKI